MIKNSTIIKYLDKILQTRRCPHEKIFGKYRVEFTELVWARNLDDGYKCQIFDKINGKWLKEITI